MAENIVISELQSMDDLSATVELQKAVWGMEDTEVASPHTLRAIVHSGGAVFGAMAQGRLVGFCFGFAAPRAGEHWLWSHMAGVHPCFQRAGVGFLLKQAQRDWALSRGYRWMAWTFDPLQCGNANFNFNRLGVIAGAYSVNHTMAICKMASTPVWPATASKPSGSLTRPMCVRWLPARIARMSKTCRICANCSM